MSHEVAVLKVADDGFVTVGDFQVHTNGSGELFVQIMKNGRARTYRMQPTADGELHIVANTVTIKRYGGSDGVVIR